MEAGRRVLITGIGGPLASQLAGRLEADDRIEVLVGMDLREPQQPLQRTDFVRADLANPLLAHTIETTRVDTLVHLALTPSPGDPSRARARERNLAAARALLAAAQRAPLVSKVVLRSSTAVYGSSARDPALFREETPADSDHACRWGANLAEVEAAARAFGRRRRDAQVTILRFASLLSARLDTALTRYLLLPVVPTPLGFDPRLQLCHAEDAVEIIRRSVVEDHPGIYNVAASGMLYLSQALRLARRPSFPVAAQLLGPLLRPLRPEDAVDDADALAFLLFGRVADLSRLRADFGPPLRTTKMALLDWLAETGSTGPPGQATRSRQPAERGGP